MSLKDRKLRNFDRREEEILAAALRLFSTDDWEGVTVEQIAREAEVGKGTIYKHFASKYEIYARLAMDFQYQIIAKFSRIDPQLPILEQFTQRLQAAWNVHLSSKELHRVFLFCNRDEFCSNLPEHAILELTTIKTQLSEPIQKLILEGIKEGIFPNTPTETLLFGAQAAFWGGIQLMWSGHLDRVDQQEHLNALIRFIIGGLTNSGHVNTHQITHGGP